MSSEFEVRATVLRSGKMLLVPQPRQMPNINREVCGRSATSCVTLYFPEFDQNSSNEMRIDRQRPTAMLMWPLEGSGQVFSAFWIRKRSLRRNIVSWLSNDVKWFSEVGNN